MDGQQKTGYLKVPIHHNNCIETIIFVLSVSLVTIKVITGDLLY
jgi:hypothetical protein